MKDHQVSSSKGPLWENIGVSEYLAYGCGDFGCSVIYFLILSISTYYYTNFVGLSAALVGTIVAATSVLDSVTDVLIGFIVDRTHSRFGKARVWLLWMCIPFAVSLIACYTVPMNATTTIKALYVFITYNLSVTVVYTATNLPYGTLCSLMTRDRHQRAIINIVRMTFSAIGGMIAVSAALPLVKFFGNDQAAWIKTMSIMAVIGMACIFVCFIKTKERIQETPEHKGQKVPAGVALRSMLTNKYWILVTLMCLVYSCYNTINSQYRTYFCQYIMGDELLMSTINTAEFITHAVVAVCCAFFIRKWGKSTIVLFGSIITCLAQFLILAAPTSLTFVTIAALIRGFGVGAFSALVFTMVADVIEYGHWRTGIRAEGLLYSANTVGQKIGSGISSVICGVLLTNSGYNGLLEVQPQSAVNTISNIYIFAPMLFWGTMAIFCLINRKLDKEYDDIISDLLAGKLSPKAKLQHYIQQSE